MRDLPRWPWGEAAPARPRGGHLVAEYAANGSAQMTQLRETGGSGYPLCANVLAPRFRHYYDRARGVELTRSDKVRQPRLIVRGRSWVVRWTACCVTFWGSSFAA